MEEMLREGLEQLDRINRFVETMRVLSELESREAVWGQTSLKQLEAKLRISAGVLEAEYGRNVIFVPVNADKDFQSFFITFSHFCPISHALSHGELHALTYSPRFGYW